LCVCVCVHSVCSWLTSELVCLVFSSVLARIRVYWLLLGGIAMCGTWLWCRGRREGRTGAMQGAGSYFRVCRAREGGEAKRVAWQPHEACQRLSIVKGSMAKCLRGPI
jgi:hypothetical protein